MPVSRSYGGAAIPKRESRFAIAVSPTNVERDRPL
jgi:hypothetical protein